MELVLCIHCRRHIGATEVACPFCATALPEQRPQRAYAGKLTRAAIFSAAVVACSSKEQPKPVPAPEPAPQQQTRTPEPPPVEPAAPADADGAAVATASDAGVPADAGLDPAVAAEQRRKRMEGLRKLEQIEKQRAKEEPLPERIMAKPYGAPPARRRIV